MSVKFSNDAEAFLSVLTLVAGADQSGSLEERVARLERYTEALDFLQKVYDQQKQQAQQQEDREPAERLCRPECLVEGDNAGERPDGTQ